VLLKTGKERGREREREREREGEREREKGREISEASGIPDVRACTSRTVHPVVRSLPFSPLPRRGSRVQRQTRPPSPSPSSPESFADRSRARDSPALVGRIIVVGALSIPSAKTPSPPHRGSTHRLRVISALLPRCESDQRCIAACNAVEKKNAHGNKSQCVTALEERGRRPCWRSHGVLETELRLCAFLPVGELNSSKALNNLSPSYTHTHTHTHTHTQ